MPRDRGAVTGRSGCAWMPCSWLSGAVAERARGAASRRVRASRLSNPIVLLHAQALLRSTPQGALLDFGRPVAVMLLGVLHLVQDSEDPWGIVAGLMAAMPDGSYLTISHPAIDIHHSQANAQRVYNERVATPQTLRTREQVARFFTGLELVEPGLVQVHQWRPEPGDLAPEGTVSAHGAVGRKAGA